MKLKKSGLPGCDKEFDKLAKDFTKKSEQERKEAIKQIEITLISLEDIGNHEEKLKTAQKYLRIMQKIQSQGVKFISEEIIRLENLLDTKMSQSKSKDLQQNLNILKSFQSSSRYDLNKDEF